MGEPWVMSETVHLFEGGPAVNVIIAGVNLTYGLSFVLEYPNATITSLGCEVQSTTRALCEVDPSSLTPGNTYKLYV